MLDNNCRTSNDVVLAAELGQALLERNKILQEALESAKLESQEKDVELELVKQQLCDFRKQIQHKESLLEEAEAYIMELDQLNDRLAQDLRTRQKQLNRLSARIRHLEQQLYGTTYERDPFIHPCNPRPWSAFSNYYFSPSPGCLCLGTRGSGTIRDVFIDDELCDQPALSSLLLNSAGQDRDCHRHPSVVFTRSSSWPSMDVKSLSDPLHVIYRHSLKSETETQNVRSQRSVESLNSTAASHSKDDSVRLTNSSCLSNPINSGAMDNSEDLKCLRDLMDDALFIKRLETIYRIKLRSQVSSDYQPSYKQLFKDAFQMIHAFKSAPASN